MEKQILRFHEDGHFRILMISDLHGKVDYNPKMKKGIEALVEHTHPDFVMLGGDQLCNITPTILHDFLESVLEPVQSRNIPWGHVFGNHDPEQDMLKEDMEQVYESFPLCLSQRGPTNISGIPNYYIPIYAHNDDRPLYNIWGLDSFSNHDDFTREWGRKKPFDRSWFLPHSFGSGHDQGCVMMNQIIWYYQQSEMQEQKYGQKIPGVMFMHVPPMEFKLIEMNPEQTNMIGNRRESPACSEINNGIVMACLERGDITGIFCGHDHLNDYQGDYNGLTLAYDGSIGYDMSTHDDLRGGRIIDVYENGAMYTKMIHLIDLLGRDAMRDPDYFEGGCKYFIRTFE